MQDPFGRRVYLAPLGLSASVEGARIETFELSADHRQLLLTLAPHAKAPSRAATLSLSVPRVEPPPVAPVGSFAVRCVGPEADAGAGCAEGQ